MLKYFWRQCKSAPSRDQNVKGTLTRGEPVKRTTAVTLQIKSIVKLSLATKNMFSISYTEIANSSLFTVELSRTTFVWFCQLMYFYTCRSHWGLGTFCRLLCNRKLFTLFCYFQKYNCPEIPKVRVFLSFNSSIAWVFKTGKAIILELSSKDGINSLRRGQS